MTFNAYNISFRRDGLASTRSSPASSGQDAAGSPSSALPPPGPAMERGDPFDELQDGASQRGGFPGWGGGDELRRGSTTGSACSAMGESPSWQRTIEDDAPNRHGSIQSTHAPPSFNKSRLSLSTGLQGTKSSLTEAFSNFSFPSNNNKSTASTLAPSSNTSFFNSRPSVPEVAYHSHPPPMEHRSSVPNIVISQGHRYDPQGKPSAGGIETAHGRVTQKSPRLSMRVSVGKDMFSPGRNIEGHGDGVMKNSRIWPSGFIGGLRGPQATPPYERHQDEQHYDVQVPTSYRLTVPPKISHPQVVHLEAKPHMIENFTTNKKDAVLCSGEGSFALPSPVYRTLRGEQSGYDSPDSSLGSPASVTGGPDWISSTPSPGRSEKLSPHYKSSSGTRSQQGSPASSSEMYSSGRKLPSPSGSPRSPLQTLDEVPPPSPPLVRPQGAEAPQQQPQPQTQTASSPSAMSALEAHGAPPHCVAEEALANHQLDETFLSLYQIRDELGSGGFGFVCSAWSVVERCEVAVKFIYKSRLHHKAYVRDWHRRQSAVGILPGADEGEYSTAMRSIPMEAALLQYCHHPGIVSFVALYEDKTFFYLVQELHGSPWSKTQLVTVEDVSFVNTHQSGLGVTTSTSDIDTVPELAASMSASTLASSSSEMSIPPIDHSVALLTPSLSGKSVNEMQIHQHDAMHKSMQDQTFVDATEEMGLAARPGLMSRRSSHDLFERIETQERFTDQQARYVFAQIVDAVAYMHRNGIVHRDIKDENIVIDDDLTVKLIDFGSAVIYDARKQPPYYTRFYGTVNFASPEIVLGYPYQAAPAEVWSLGVLLSILLTGVAPFDGPQGATSGQPPRFKNSERIHPEAIDLMRRCLNPDPTRRITIEHVKRHRWLAGSGIEKVNERTSPDGKELMSVARNPMGFRPITQETASSRSHGR